MHISMSTIIYIPILFRHALAFLTKMTSIPVYTHWSIANSDSSFSSNNKVPRFLGRAFDFEKYPAKTTQRECETAGSLLSKKDIIHPLLTEREKLRLA